jgi:hypothetical protein
MALAPCLIGYGAIARRLHSDEATLREGNQYLKWIENYVADDYTEAVRLGSGKSTTASLTRSCTNFKFGRTTGETYAKGITQSHGGVNPDLYASDRIGDPFLGYGVERPEGVIQSVV